MGASSGMIMFDALVNPRRPISMNSESHSWYFPGDVRGHPPIEQVLPRLYRFVQQTVVVGHDVAFDCASSNLQGRDLGRSIANPVA